MDLAVEDFNILKERLYPIAYNILGSIEDAEDIIQNTLIKWAGMDKTNVENPMYYLKKATINASINYKQLQRKQREVYPGTWLPEPTVKTFTDGLERDVDREFILSYSLLVLLELLNPKERAVFILRESFDYSHKEISDILSISEDGARQLLKRAKKKLKDRDTIQRVDKRVHKEILSAFLNSLEGNDLMALENLLSDDVKLFSDGGGKVTAATKILIGKNNIARFFIGIYSKKYFRYTIEIKRINQEWGLFFYRDGDLTVCFVPEIHSNRIADGYLILNPDKLKKN